MEQSIRRPDWERGDKKAVMAWLGIGENAFDDLYKSGWFPPGDRINKNNHSWYWQDVVAFSWLMPHLLRLREKFGEKVEDS